jgi:tripartite-type tricarboxylate transporter receptor subunit TctC
MMLVRHLLSLGIALFAGVATAPSGFAQDYPNRAIRLIVGYAPGGINDQMARIIGERMAKELGQQIVIENKPGAGTAVASTFVAQAEPDGYTVLFGTNSLAINPALSPKLTPKNPQAELLPVGLALESPFYLLVSKNWPFRNVEELVAYAKANPNKLNFGSSGNGSTSHLILELFNNRFGTRITHVPYRGAAPTMVDLMAGRIDGAFATPVDATPALESGDGVPIAVTSLEPLALKPELAPIAKTQPGFRGVFWTGLFVPVNTPPKIVATLDKALAAATRDPEIVAKARERGVTMLTGGPEALRDLLAQETASWSKLIQDANLRAD